jgi:multidrug efflux pump subunit AcrA (membrane-fusion protein)
MTAPFVIDLGFSRNDYAAIVKGAGLAATLIGGFAGGFVARRYPLATSLWIGGVLQAVANLSFSWLALVGVNQWALAFAITAENFTSAIGTVIFVAYLSALCRNPLHTATQYALLTALAAVGRTYLSSGAGYVAKATGWPLFFAICVIVAIPSLVLLAWLIFGSMRYRVDAPFALRTENAVFVTAPFNSFIDEVKVEPGSAVKKGDILATLDTRELVAEEGNALADHDAYIREIRKAGAASKLAEMGIASARAEQAWAKLEIAQLRRSQSSITAPFDGVVIEGDLKKRLGAPVHQGDVLFRIARTDQFYVECQVSESDVRELQSKGAGEISFASQPKLTFPVRIRQIDPVAEAKPAGNFILARCDLTRAPEEWWRPGMSGVAKLDVGERSPGWILTRRTVDYLRLHLWW